MKSQKPARAVNRLMRKARSADLKKMTTALQILHGTNKNIVDKYIPLGTLGTVRI